MKRVLHLWITAAVAAAACLPASAPAKVAGAALVRTVYGAAIASDFQGATKVGSWKLIRTR